jgi:hypothetical protein
LLGRPLRKPRDKKIAILFSKKYSFFSSSQFFQFLVIETLDPDLDPDLDPVLNPDR